MPLSSELATCKAGTIGPLASFQPLELLTCVS